MTAGCLSRFLKSSQMNELTFSAVQQSLHGRRGENKFVANTAIVSTFAIVCSIILFWRMGFDCHENSNNRSFICKKCSTIEITTQQSNASSAQHVLFGEDEVSVLRHLHWCSTTVSEELPQRRHIPAFEQMMVTLRTPRFDLLLLSRQPTSRPM